MGWSGRLERRCRRAAGGGDDGDEGGSGAGAGGWLSPEGDESVGRYARAGGSSVSQCRGSQSGRDSCRLEDAAGMRVLAAAAGREGRRGRDASVAVLGHPLSRWCAGSGSSRRDGVRQGRCGGLSCIIRRNQVAMEASVEYRERVIRDDVTTVKGPRLAVASRFSQENGR